MKRKISVRLSEEIVERLEAAAQRPGANKTTILEAALDRLLDPAAETIDDATLLRRLDCMSRQLEQLEHGLKIVNETVALHARYHLAVTPPLPQSQQRAACALGLERFEEFAAQVGRRVHLGLPLMRETMDRLGTRGPHLFARNIGQGAEVGAANAASDQDVAASTVVNESQGLPAAAQEDGSSGGFPGNGHNPSG
ncbi:MAG: ribbon-helix-helix protein, CopG family [Rhodoplanes sp.]